MTLLGQAPGLLCAYLGWASSWRLVKICWMPTSRFAQW